MVLFVQAPLKNSVDWYRSHWLNEQPYEAHLVDVATKVRMVRSVFFLEAWIWRDRHLSTIFSNPIETEWSWVVWHTSICFVLFRHVWLCLVSRVPCVSTLRNLWEPKLEPIWTGARLCSPTALWGNKEALWRKLPRFPKTPCGNHAENDVDLEKKTHHFANTEGESERLYHPFVVSYLFLSL